MELDNYLQYHAMPAKKFEKEELFWNAVLENSATIGSFPKDKRLSIQVASIKSIRFNMAEEVSEKLMQFSNRSEFGIYLILLTNIFQLVYQYSGCDDIILGMPLMKKHTLDNSLNKMLAIRCKENRSLSFKERLMQIQNLVNEAIENQNFPLEIASEKSGLTLEGDQLIYNIVVEMESLHNCIPISDTGAEMHFSFCVEENTVGINITFNENIFDSQMIKRLGAHLTTHIENVTRDPYAVMSEVEILAAIEKKELLEEFNNTVLEIPLEKPYHVLFEAQVKNNPDSIAVCQLDNKISYQELNVRANQLARVLRNIGVKKESLVCIKTAPSILTVIAILAVLKAGGAYLPIDMDYPKEREAYIFKDSGSNILLTDGQSAKKTSFPGSIIFVDDMSIYSGDTTNIENISEFSDLAYCIYTSGTTGVPKGVLIEHQNLVNYINSFSTKVSLNSQDKTLLLSSYSFDLCYTSLFPVLLKGGELHIVPKEMYLDAKKLLEYMNKKEISYIKLTPSLFNIIVNSKIFDTAEICGKLRLIVLGGEEINLADVEKFHSYYQNTEIMNHYGPTETTVGAIAHLIDFNAFDEYIKRVVIGKPLGNVQVHILDKNLRLLPIGAKGEIYITGKGLARGYINREEQSEEKFISNPFSGVVKKDLYKTGDYGLRCSDGSIIFLGRADHQVKIRGYRVELHDIERYFLKHPLVNEALVIVENDKKGMKYLHAFLGVTEAINLQIIRNFLYEGLPDYMVPSQFTQLKAMPLTGNGKIDRTALANEALWLKQEYNQTTGLYDTNVENEIENATAQIWCELLNTDRDGINLTSNFFEIGGNSLLLIQMQDKLEKMYPGAISVSDIFGLSTIKKISGFIKTKISTSEVECSISEKSNQNEKKDSQRILVDKSDIAIIGMSAKFPSANTIDEYWENVKNGKDCIRKIPDHRKKDIEQYLQFMNQFNKEIQYQEIGYMDDIDKFDYNFFRISPREASLMDPCQRLFLQTAWSALEDAGYGGKKLEGSRTGTYVGYGGDAVYKRIISDVEPESMSIAHAGNVPQIIASRLAYMLDFRGPSLLVDTACSSSSVAIHLACQGILNGECDLALAGSIKLVLFAPKSEIRLGIESSDGKTRAFDDASDGTGFGEGSAAILLKPLHKAIDDGDHVYAVIKGTAVNQDGKSIGITAPNPAAQEDVILRAWEKSGIDPLTISYIEAHGTGTKLGDPIEVEGITRAFKHFTDKKQFCAIGSVKSNVGHLDYAPGIAGVIKSVMAMRHKQIPPTLHFNKPNRNIDFINSPVYVNDILSEWKSSSHLRRCGVSSFGMGGTNCHIVLEEALEESFDHTLFHVDSDKIHRIFTISAKSKVALVEWIKNYAEYFKKHKVCFEDACYVTNTGRGHYNHRVALIGKNINQVIETLSVINSTDDLDIQHQNFYYNVHKIVSNSKNAREKGELDEQEQKILGINAGKLISTLIEVPQNEMPYLKELALLYVQGADIHWDSLFSHEKRNRIPLPTYPFEKNRCWISLPTEKMDGRHGQTNRVTKRNSFSTELVPLGAGKNNTYFEIEHIVVNIFSEMLGLSKINVSDNFYEMGVDSILMTRIVNNLNKAFDVKIQANEPFIYTNIALFTKRIMEKYIKTERENVYDQFIVNVKGEVYKSGKYYPTSAAQKRIYILNQFENIGTSYNLTEARMVKGHLDVNRLKNAFEQLIERHEGLRTSFEIINGEIVQIVYNSVKFKIEFFEGAETDCSQIIEKFVRPFQLDQAPLFRVALITLTEDEHILLTDIHHIICDGTSSGILNRDFMHYYEELALPELRVQYKDFAVWQNKLYGSNYMKEQEAFWLNKFSDDIPHLNIPTDFKRPENKSFEGNYIAFEMDEEMFKKINESTVKTSTTLYMFLLSIFSILLSKYANCDDVVVGCPIAGRHHADLENVLGVFINTIVMRNTTLGNKTFKSFLSDTKTNTLEAYNNQDFQFEELVNKLQVERDSSRNPLFETLFVLQNVNNEDIELNDLHFSPYEFRNNVSIFDIRLEACELGQKLMFKLEYCTKLYTEQTMQRFAEDYIRIADCVLKNMDIKISDITLGENTLLIGDTVLDEIEFECNRQLHRRLFKKQNP